MLTDCTSEVQKDEEEGKEEARRAGGRRSKQPKGEAPSNLISSGGESSPIFTCLLTSYSTSYQLTSF